MRLRDAAQIAADRRARRAATTVIVIAPVYLGHRVAVNKGGRGSSRAADRAPRRLPIDFLFPAL